MKLKIWQRLWLLFDRAHLSYTKISNYLKCPYLYRLLNVQGLRIPLNPYISLGTSIHNTLERYHRKKEESMQMLMDIYGKCWSARGYADQKQEDEFRKRGKDMLEGYFRSRPSMFGTPVYLEKRFSFNVGRHVVTGIIDRIDRTEDGRYEIIDYKTHFERWTRQQVDDDLQLTLYSLACRRSLGIEPGYLSFSFLNFNEKVRTSRTPEQEEEACRLVREVGDKVLLRMYAPDHSACPGCNMRDVCPEKR